MKKDDELKVHADGTIPLITGDIHVVYSESEVNTNWLLNKILGTKGKQITKISDQELLTFLKILDEGNLEMPDGSNSLEWLKQRIGKRFEQSKVQRGQSWEQVCRRYQFVLEQIDIILALK